MTSCVRTLSRNRSITRFLSFREKQHTRSCGVLLSSQHNNRHRFSMHRQTHTQTRSFSTQPASSSSSASGKAGLLQDEYHSIDRSGMKTWFAPRLVLESGDVLTNVPVCYQSYGTLNPAGDNVLLVCHALTGHAALHDWWGSLLGEGKAFDTSKYFVLCANLLGSCYGTAGPTEINPQTGKRYGVDFPVVTVRDSVALHHQLLFDALGVTRVISVIGGSLGGMQALEWGFFGAKQVQSMVALSCNTKHSAWQIAINHVQRQAILCDPDYQQGNYYDSDRQPNTGLSLARQFAMISYRTQPVYQKKFSRSITASPSHHHQQQRSPPYEIERYLLYQGKKLVSRFDANSYIRLTQVLDSHDIGRNRGGEAAALKTLTQPVLVMGVDSDVLYPMHEQEELAALIPHSTFIPIHSLEGHDGFLLEQEQIGTQITNFLHKHGQIQSETQQQATHISKTARAKTTSRDIEAEPTTVPAFAHAKL